jgi:hypothetical protein
VDLLVAGVLVVDRQLLKLPCDVIRCPGIHVPVCVHTIGGGSRSSSLLGRTGEVGIEPLVASIRRMSFFATHLVDHASLKVAVTSSATTTTTFGTTSKPTIQWFRVTVYTWLDY